MSNPEMISEKKFSKVTAAADSALAAPAKARVSSLKRFAVVSGLYKGTIMVPSSSIASLRYNRSNRTLDLSFRNGSGYRYFEVEPGVVKRLLGASSIGRQFNMELRNEFTYQLLAGRRKPSVQTQKTLAAAKAPAASKKSHITV